MRSPRLISVFLSLCVVVLSPAVFASPNGSAAVSRSGEHLNRVLIGKIYGQGSARKKLLFNFRRTVHKTGRILHVRRAYSYPGGKIAVVEQATYRNRKLVSYTLDDKQTGAHGGLKIDGDARRGQGKITFRYVNDGKTKTNSEKLNKPTVTNETIVPYMLSHWDDLMAGKPVNARYMVIPRRETVGFTLKKSGATQWRGKPAVQIKMTPASFIVSMIIDPVYFTFDKKTRALLEYKGRTTPKIKRNGKWRNLDAITVFKWRTK